MTSIVTTNLRIPKADWIQIRTNAAERNVSVNEYVKQILASISIYRELGLDKPLSSRHNASLWNLPQIASRKLKATDLSDEDKIIYE